MPKPVNMPGISKDFKGKQNKYKTSNLNKSGFFFIIRKAGVF